MKNIPAILIAALAVCVCTVDGYARGGIINIITYGGEVCGPVTIKCSQGSFTVYNGQTIEGNLLNLEAWDCRGNRILDTSYDTYHYNSETGITERNYHFTQLRDDGGGYTDGNTYTPSYEPSLGKQIADGWGEIMRRGQGIDVEGVPFLSMDLGMSVFYGEFVRANFATAGMTGFLFYTGVGKDWIFDRRNSDKFLWHVGVGMLLNLDLSHFHLGLVVGENPLCYNQGLLCEFGYHQFFGDSKILGFVLGAGVGLGNFKAKDPDMVWDVQVGLAVKLWQR